MRPEKIIRSQAKEALKGNWIAAVSGVFVLLAVIFLIDVFYELLLNLTGIISGNTLKKGGEFALIIILCATFLFYFALSPFKNGYLRLCYNIAQGRSDGLRDIFYYFSGIKVYFKALQFNIIIMLKKILYALISFIPYFLCLLFELVLFTNFIKPTSSTNALFDTLEFVLMIIGSVSTVIISIRLIIPEFVFVDNPEANTFGIAKFISSTHLREYYKLVFSFAFWILSCFFVLPGLYVIPYLTTSLGTSSKWLINNIQGR